ncbi:MAG: serine/threonine protein phosphatase, partial [Oscillospiraceae bacterium]|nr:serine/threonine protein phosphatase [Oscillospiraceae bacterium]
DFVDDDTSREDMLGGCEALGGLKTTCGVFFVYGNHDSGYFSEEARGWSGAELRDALEANGVVVLEDAFSNIGDGLIIAGRKDRSVEQRGGARKTAAELLCGLDQSAYIVLLDHQPHDFDAEAAAGADLVLCGHTHGGQFIPINHVGEWIGENCLRYGHEKRLDTDFIVSSGISNWSFRFKTGCKSEYVVIDLIPATEG